MQKMGRWRLTPSIVPSGNFAELNRTVTCVVLKANDRRTSCHDEFRGPRSDYVRQVALETTNSPIPGVDSLRLHFQRMSTQKHRLHTNTEIADKRLLKIKVCSLSFFSARLRENLGIGE
ncbi:hypothetical protein TNCV_3449211 [Trichonephila clavipes]|nr:hypothetical protein TNCV_3449211 [Trichonephila clavipes]